MDLLLSESRLNRSLAGRYAASAQVGSFYVHSMSSGNLEVVTYGGEIAAVVVGCLFGPLKDAEKLQRASKEELGRFARASEGSFAVVIPRGKEVLVVTDAGGSIPVYYGHGPEDTTIGTVVHHVARCSGLTSVDRVSAVDFLLHGTVCQPYAWYEGVRVLPPGAVCTVGPQEMDSCVYWRPTEPENVRAPCDIQEWAERLRDTVRTAVELTLDGVERARVLFSGGEDARAVLGLVPDHVSCTPTTVLGHKNREYWLAKWAAQGGLPAGLDRTTGRVLPLLCR